ncbi:MAG: hypothetical protein AAB953_02595, partial [Patescibacteria group bacterium]
MEKFNRILKNVLLFLVIFLIINYIFSFFKNDDTEKLALNAGNLSFSTTDTEYSRRQTVKVEILNDTKEAVVIPNE